MRMSAGVASGDFTFAVIGETHHELLVLGPWATHTVALESRANAGQVLVCDQTALDLDGSIEAVDVDALAGAAVTRTVAVSVGDR